MLTLRRRLPEADAEEPTEEEFDTLDSDPDSPEDDVEEDEPATAALPFREH